MDGVKRTGYKLTSEWRNQFKMTPVFMSTAGSHRTMKRAIRCLNKWVDSNFCWAAINDAVLTTKQIQLLQRGSDWMTPLGGAKSKVNIVYICICCRPKQGSVVSNGWFITMSGVVVGRYTGKLTKLVNPTWKCPFCGAKYSLVSGARALIIDDRDSPEDAGEVLIFPLTYLKHQWEKGHPDYELDKQVEALLNWLRMVSLMDQLTVIDADSIRDASARTNYMVVNRLKASRSMVYKRTRNICTGNVQFPTSNAHMLGFLIAMFIQRFSQCLSNITYFKGVGGKRRKKPRTIILE